jgi:phospholipid/cholesterol/gamma-HCH transport system substrate-binding protein
MTAIRKHLRDFAAIVGIGVVALAVAGYVLAHERLRFPLLQPAPFQLKAEFTTAQAVTPGQGQTVRVSGVRIGDISKAELQDGRAVVTMDIDPEYKGLIHTDATALLRPKTGLKDMFVELDPGTNGAPRANAGWTIPVRNTLPDVNPDEILSVLDEDTRDYLQLLVSGAGQGLRGRGHDLQEVFRRFEPTHRDLARVSTAVAARRTNLRRLIHSLAQLNGALATHGDEIAQLVDSSSAVFRAFASEQGNVSQAVGDLPGALRETTQTLGKVQRLAGVLRPAADALRPAARSLDAANHAVRPFAKEAAPILQREVRPFVRDARPLVRQLQPAASKLTTATPDLTRTFTVLNHLFNMVGFNPGGRQDPSNKARDEGFLFWIAWLDHNAAAVFSASDANGTFRPITLGSDCSALRQVLDANGFAGLTSTLAPVLADPKVCPGQPAPSAQAAAARGGKGGR